MTYYQQGAWCALGKVLEYGKHYSAFIVNENGKKKEYPADDEIKKAVCRDCAKELFDSQEIRQAKIEKIKKLWSKECDGWECGKKLNKILSPSPKKE